MENTNVKENLEQVIIKNTLKLTRPVDIDGKKVKEIKYDVEKLTGRDVERAIKDLAQRKIAVAVPEVDSSLHCQLFAYASGLDYTDIQRLNIVDYVKAIGIIRDFFIA